MRGYASALTVAIILCLGMAIPAVAQRDVLAVDGTEIFRMRDINGDGDALDIGESLLWTNQFTSLSGMTQLAADVLAVDFSAGQVLRLADLNRDGDALDAGEAFAWADDPLVAGFVDIRARGAAVFASDGASNVYRLQDLNGDGDAQDVDELVLYATGLAGARALETRSGELLVGDNVANGIFRLVDLNGDGDAQDVLEMVPYSSLPLDANSALLTSRENTLFASEPGGALVRHVEDLNGDGDALDLTEVLSYAGGAFGGLSNPAQMTAYPGADFLLANAGDGLVLRVRDANGDGDALDMGDVVHFATGFGTFLDLLAVPRLVGDYNEDGSVGAADYPILRDTLGLAGAGLAADGNGDNVVDDFDYRLWRMNYGLSDMAAAALVSGVAVPEPASLSMAAAALLSMVAGLPYRARRKMASRPLRQ